VSRWLHHFKCQQLFDWVAGQSKLQCREAERQAAIVEGGGVEGGGRQSCSAGKRSAKQPMPRPQAGSTGVYLCKFGGGWVGGSQLGAESKYGLGSAMLIWVCVSVLEEAWGGGGAERRSGERMQQEFSPTPCMCLRGISDAALLKV
jgi:hypothetical protein